MKKLKLVDLFCGAGIGADGYKEAGFDVEGIDLNPQPNYPFKFSQVDCMNVLIDPALEQYDVIHASPPCQLHTRAKHLRDAQGGVSKYVDLLTPVLDILKSKWSHKIWVVENVPGAPGMEDAVTVCGSSFDLGVRRHRLFLSNVSLVGSKCDHKSQGRPWGVYHVPSDNIPKGGRTATDVEHGKAVMGVDKNRNIKWTELKEGIPPEYTKFIGKQVKAYIDLGKPPNFKWPIIDRVNLFKVKDLLY